jgi:hypothetical protein
MKYVLAIAMMAAGLFGLAGVGASAWADPAQVVAHHSTAHSVGPCGLQPCKPDRRHK